jgi:hypothetical protein
MRWAGNVACMGKMKNAYILITKPKWKKSGKDWFGE